MIKHALSMSQAVFCLLLGLTNPACSDPRDATERNFAAAIDRELANDRSCLQFKLPMQVPLEKDGTPARYARSDTLVLDRLVEAGLVSNQHTDIPEPFGFGKPRMIPHVVYALTDAGKAAQAKDRIPGFFDLSGIYLCYGTGKVEEVTNFSAPTESAGTTVTTVQYRYKIKDVASWAKTPGLAEADSRVAAALSGTALNGQINLMLTGKGWQTQDEFARSARR